MNTARSSNRLSASIRYGAAALAATAALLTAGCGSTSMLATGSLDTNGQGSVTLHFHSAGCGNSTSTEKFAVQTLNANGSGTASLSCNNDSGCGINTTPGASAILRNCYGGVL